MNSLPQCRFGWDDDAIAEAMGLSVTVEAGFGAAGSAYHLEDGRILKLKISSQEAAMALMGIQGRLDGLPLPEFSEVWKYEPEALGETPCWAIVREEVADLYENPTPREWEKVEAWNKVQFAVSQSCSPEEWEKAAARWDVHGTELREFLEGVKEVESALGIELGDWLAENVGRLKGSGKVVLRDLSSVNLSQKMMENIGLDLDSVPVLEMRLVTSPGPAKP